MPFYKKAFLNIQDLCNITGLSRSTVMRKVRSQAYPFDKTLKVGKRRLFSAKIIDDLTKIAESHKQPAEVVK
jgi:predicted DNA-binding transcriptional regulator AlpA